MNAEFIEALKDLERERGIEMVVLLEAIEAALVAAYKKNFGSSQNVRVEIDRLTGDIHVYYRKEVVEELEDDRVQMSLAQAKSYDPDFEVGDFFESEVTPRSFGRIAAQTAKHVVVQRIREAERNLIYDQYTDRKDDIITGVVVRQEGRNYFIDLGKSEALLAPGEQIPGENYRQGSRMKFYLVEVKKTTKGPQVMLSRSHPGLLKRLFEMEVPEIHDGVVEIKSVVREPGARAKIAVHTERENVDPVGACVGAKGMRVQSIVNELCGEKIEIVRWDEDPVIYVSNALAPAKAVYVEIYEEDRSAFVVVPDFQLSLAIGRSGQNARLAARLTGWKIDIKSESQMAALAEQAEASDSDADEDLTDQEEELWNEEAEVISNEDAEEEGAW
ncbi:MAG: transcription termination factor NusA [Clostridiales bacterium]|jgi:N utilization substance protein A|nr:transcription termination factor NusA [Clostridiales bacterium]MDR2713475.1 transcription termination factor NusA [Clostridiales bacterium]